MKQRQQIASTLQRLKTIGSGLCLVLGLMLWVQQASAAVCTVTPVVAPVFASYQGVQTDATGSITVVCTSLLPESVSYTVRLGLSSQAVGTQRQMALGAGRLSYNFFCTNGYSQVWADGSGGTCVAPGGGTVLVLFPLVTAYTVYGRIPGGQLAAAGTYTDTVAIQVLY